jgi:aspartyl-tRNA synthetase
MVLLRFLESMNMRIFKHLLRRVRLFTIGLLQACERLPVLNDVFNFLWVVDFPLFALKDEAFQDLNSGNEGLDL